MDNTAREYNRRSLAQSRQLIQHGRQMVLEIKRLCDQTQQQIARSQARMNSQITVDGNTMRLEEFFEAEEEHETTTSSKGL
jgi:hypothetical protein